MFQKCIVKALVVFKNVNFYRTRAAALDDFLELDI